MTDIKYLDNSGLGKIKSILDNALSSKANTSSLGSYAYKSGSNASGTWPISITGNASSATLLKPNSGITTDVAAWDPLSSYTKCWGQKFINSSLSSDTGDILYYLRRGDSGYGTSATAELCICIDGDYYGKGGGGTPKKVSYEDHNHTKSQITDFPTSLPASDVYAWAKAANKPTYTASEVGAAESGHNHDSIYCKYSHNYSVSAGDGNNHYYKILTLAVTANAAWHDMFYEVKVSGRGTYYGNIRIFAATHAVDKYIGQIEITCDGSVKDLLYAYQIRNTTTKTDTIELWMNVVSWGTFYFYEREYKNSGGISITVNKTDGGALPTSYHDKINITGQVTNGNSVLGHTHTKSEVGLGNVDNTADANKSVNHANTAGSATNAHNIISSNGTNLLKSNSSGEITITSPTDLLTINSTGKQTYSLLYFSKNGTRKACTGYYEGMAFISNETYPYPRIGVKDDGTPQYWPSNNSSTAQTILHTGNYTTWCATSSHDHNNVYASISHGIHWNNFSNRALNSATWGTLTSANGYTPIFWMDSVNGGGVAFSDYDGQTFMQIDGDYYANEGKSKVWHAGNLTKVSQLTNDANYTTATGHTHSYLPLSGGILTGTTGLTLQNSKLWVQGGSDAGSNSNRMTLDYGAPADMKYQSGKRGLMLYSNAIAICDPYNGNSNNDSAWIRHIEETANTSVLEIALGDDGDTSEELRFRKYNTSNQIVYDILVPRKSGTVALTSDIPTNNNQLTNGAGYITGINKTMVTNALGYTPYNSTNPNGYITSSGSITGSSGSCTGNAATATLATSAKRCSTKQSSAGNSSANYYKVTGLIEHTSNRQATYIITTRLNENYYISVGTCDGDNTKLPHITRIHNSYSKITGFTYKSGVLYIKTVAYNNTVGVANITNLSDTTVAIANSSESEYNAGTIVPIWDNLNSGNSSVSKSGQTLTVTINGVSQSLTNTDTNTDTNTWLGDGAWAPGTNVKLNATANDQEWSFDIERNGKTGCHWHVWDSSLKSLLIVYPDNGIVEAPYGFKGSLTGNASSTTLLKPNSGITTNAATWHPLTSFTKCWGQNFTSSSLSSDTGDILYYLRRGDSGYGSSGTTELCICIDGDYYGKGGGGTPKKVSYEDHTHTSFASSITVTGKVSASQGFFQTSDERLKDFQDDIQVDLDKIKALPKKYFTWKDDESKENQIGTSAQAVQEIYPELVSTGDNGKLSVAYDKLSIIALKAVDELHDENQKLKDEVNQLRSDIDKIKQMLGI